VLAEALDGTAIKVLQMKPGEKVQF
jgi:hypothetical protein